MRRGISIKKLDVNMNGYPLLEEQEYCNPMLIIMAPNIELMPKRDSRKWNVIFKFNNH